MKPVALGALVTSSLRTRTCQAVWLSSPVVHHVASSRGTLHPNSSKYASQASVMAASSSGEVENNQKLSAKRINETSVPQLRRTPQPSLLACAQNLAAGTSKVALKISGAAGSPCKSDLVLPTGCEQVSWSSTKTDEHRLISRSHAAIIICGTPLLARP